MGQGGSKGPNEQILAELPDGERYFGLENFGNTCYCNAVLQALYFCAPFRERLLLFIEAENNERSRGDKVKDVGILSPTSQNSSFLMNGGTSNGSSSSLASRFIPASNSVHGLNGGTPGYHGDKHGKEGDRETLLLNLGELFLQIASQKKRYGYISPRKFVSRVKAESDLFSSYMHQDAHEFLNFLLNDLSETVARKELGNRKKIRGGRGQGHNSLSKKNAKSGGLHTRTPSLQALHEANQEKERDEDHATVRTWVDELFQGKLVSETQCLQCENVTSRQEPFYDLPLEIEPNCSVSACLRRFSSTETLDGIDKFSCDQCGCKQEAHRRMRIAELPPVLCLHMKRFKFIESLGQMKKLTHRVVFPFSLKLPNTTDDCPDVDVMYELFAVVVHMGVHMNHGHYVALIRSGGQWLCFDDESVHGITEDQVRSTFGSSQEASHGHSNHHIGHADHAYILFYGRTDESEEDHRSESSSGRMQDARSFVDDCGSEDSTTKYGSDFGFGVLQDER